MSSSLCYSPQRVTMCPQASSFPRSHKGKSISHAPDVASNNDPKEPNLQIPLIRGIRRPDDQGLQRTCSNYPGVRESISIAKIAVPMTLIGLLLYCRSLISMLFLSRLGDLALAGGSLAVVFANFTGYSILSGLALGMEPICRQAFSAKRDSLLALSLQRTVLLLLFISLPISLLWINMKRVLLFCGQDEVIATQAQSYLLCLLPDLLTQSFLHSITIYFRCRSITYLVTYCAFLSVLLHLSNAFILVFWLNMGIEGVALSGVYTNLVIFYCIIFHIIRSGVWNKIWDVSSAECSKEWKTLLNLGFSSCVSACLEWGWYILMILLCGLLINPRAKVASMGILIQMVTLIHIFPSSLGFGVSTIVGNELAANNPKNAKLASILGLSCSCSLGFSALFFAVMGGNIWARLFTQDKEIIALTSLVLPIIGLSELGKCLQTTGWGVLRGTGRAKVGANICLGCFCFAGGPMAVALSFFRGFDFEGLWLGLLAAQGLCALTTLVVLARINWDFEAQRARQLIGVVVENSEEDEVDKGYRSGIKEESQYTFSDLDLSRDCDLVV